MVSGKLRSVNNLDVNFAATVSSNFPSTEFRHQATMTSESTDNRRKPFLSFLTGAVIGVLGGLIGLGGAEFRLPVLLTVFGYATLPAVIVNLVVSLVTVVFSFIFRLNTIGEPIGGRQYSCGLAHRLLLWRSSSHAYRRARIATHGRGLTRNAELAIDESRVNAGHWNRPIEPAAKSGVGFSVGCRDWGRQQLARGGRGRTHHTDDRLAIRHRHQTGGQFESGDQRADNIDGTL
jgi:hypothetical protein